MRRKMESVDVAKPPFRSTVRMSWRHAEFGMRRRLHRAIESRDDRYALDARNPH